MIENRCSICFCIDKLYTCHQLCGFAVIICTSKVINPQQVQIKVWVSVLDHHIQNTLFQQNTSIYQNTLCQVTKTCCLIPSRNSKNTPWRPSITLSHIFQRSEKNHSNIASKQGHLWWLKGYPTLTCSRVDHGVCCSSVQTSITRPADSVVNSSSWYHCGAATIIEGWF